MIIYLFIGKRLGVNSVINFNKNGEHKTSSALGDLLEDLLEPEDLLKRLKIMR